MKSFITNIPELAELLSLNALVELKFKALHDRIECYEAIHELSIAITEAESQEEIDEIVNELKLIHQVLATIDEATVFVDTEFDLIGYRLN
jgi:hypothetical protein